MEDTQLQDKKKLRQNRFASIRQSLSSNTAILATTKRLAVKLEQRKRRSSIQILQKESVDFCNFQISSEGDDQYRSLFNDRYELKEKAGEGAHGVVKRCIDKRTKEVCAVKIQPLETEHILLYKKNFEDIKGLQHPHILTYKALFFQKKKSMCYLVMDFVPFPSLEESVIESEEQFKEVTYQIINTLRYIHDRKICHRDIKPENILYDKDNKSIKIIDFGISKKVEERGRKRDMLTPTGTPFYRAPEMLEGGGYDEMVDMWALGVTMFKIMSGFTPFESEYHIDTITNIIKGQVVFPLKFKFECSQAPKNLIKRLIRRNPKERFTAEQALKDIWFLDLSAKEDINGELCQSLTFQKMEYSCFDPKFSVDFNFSHDPSPTKKKKGKKEQQFKSIKEMMEETECSIFGMEESEMKDLPSPTTPV